MAARLITGGDTSATVRDWDHARALAEGCAECTYPVTACGVCPRCDPEDVGTCRVHPRYVCPEVTGD